VDIRTAIAPSPTADATPLDGLAAHVCDTPLEHGGPRCARRRTALVPATHARPTRLRVLVVPLTGHMRIMV
jgi:hypothetical protein